MIDLFVRRYSCALRSRELNNPHTLPCQDGINNDALLIDDCNGNPAPHHWYSRPAQMLGSCAFEMYVDHTFMVAAELTQAW